MASNGMNTARAIEQTRSNDVQLPPQPSPALPGPSCPQEPAFAPACDIADLGKEYLLTADLPGVDAASVSVTFEDGLLSIHASAAPRDRERGLLLRREYGVGDFRRQFRLGEDVDVERICAECRDGVLRVRLPKVPAASPKKVTVKAG